MAAVLKQFLGRTGGCGEIERNSFSTFGPSLAALCFK